MAVRHRPGARTDSSADPQPLVVIFDDNQVRPPRRVQRRWLAALLLAVLAVGAGSWWWVSGGASPVEVSAGTRSASPATLAVSVQAPQRVVAGQPARFVVSYTDGEGIFSGAIEDWADTGVGSVSLGACDASAPVAAPLRASYVATHTWPEAASYPVSFSVTTYTCRDGRATPESHQARLTVVVDAR